MRFSVLCLSIMEVFAPRPLVRAAIESMMTRQTRSECRMSSIPASLRRRHPVESRQHLRTYFRDPPASSLGRSASFSQPAGSATRRSTSSRQCKATISLSRAATGDSAEIMSQNLKDSAGTSTLQSHLSAETRSSVSKMRTPSPAPATPPKRTPRAASVMQNCHCVSAHMQHRRCTWVFPAPAGPTI